jgi:hypothetical protein
MGMGGVGVCIFHLAGGCLWMEQELLLSVAFVSLGSGT